jgi:hypothetical protein
MSNFIQSNSHDMDMYAKIQYYNMHIFCNLFFQDLTSWNFI